MISKTKPVLLLICLMLMKMPSLFAQLYPLRFSAEGFKIVQFTDTHIKANREASLISIETINTVLDIEKPDLVVYTGDVVVGMPVLKGWDMVLQPCIERKIPYAVVFGNHDDERGVSREKLADKISKMPFSLMVKKVEGVTGYGNYVLEISASENETTAALLYCMDSNAYSTVPEIDGYGWFLPDQINWYKTQSVEFNKKNGEKLPALAFFHIPLPEFSKAFVNGDGYPVGSRNEKECAPKYNSGMFSAIEKSKDVMGIFVGHDHVNDYLASYKGIALGYGRFTGSSTTYGELECGARIIVLAEGERSFTTWIRIRNGKRLYQVKFPADFQKQEGPILTYQ